MNELQKELLSYIKKWLNSSHTYTVRFAVEMLMCHVLDEDFSPQYTKADTKKYYLR